MAQLRYQNFKTLYLGLLRSVIVVPQCARPPPLARCPPSQRRSLGVATRTSFVVDTGWGRWWRCQGGGRWLRSGLDGLLTMRTRPFHWPRFPIVRRRSLVVPPSRPPPLPPCRWTSSASRSCPSTDIRPSRGRTPSEFCDRPSPTPCPRAAPFLCPRVRQLLQEYWLFPISNLVLNWWDPITNPMDSCTGEPLAPD